MAERHLMQAGDEEPPLYGAFVDGLGTAIDLTGASVFLETSITSWDADSAATITDAAGGLVEYRWAAADTSAVTPGVYEARWRIEYASGRVQHVPPPTLAAIQLYIGAGVQ